MNNQQKVHQDIKKAEKIINLRFYQPVNEFSKYSSLYAFTNENIHSVYDYLMIKNKKVLTIAGSGDHLFEAYLKEAKEVKCFDINYFTKYYILLKIAALKALPDIEFMNFLDENTRLFWDELYNKYPGKVIRNSKLFYTTEESLDFLKDGLSYLQTQNYQKLKKIFLENPNIFSDNSFFNTTVTEIPKKINEQFDIIYLSNIPDYLNEIFHKPYIENFQLFLKNKLDPMLTDTGKILAAYIFWAEYNGYRNSPLIRHKKSKEKFIDENYEYAIIDNSHLRKCTNDGILIYKKTR